MKPYTPISCSFYSRLEQLAISKMPVPLVYRDDEELRSLSQAIIEDVFMREKEEYLRLSSGTEIRLDSLISVNGIPLRRNC
jgi:Rho-binding antiterminator